MAVIYELEVTRDGPKKKFFACPRSWIVSGSARPRFTLRSGAAIFRGRSSCPSGRWDGAASKLTNGWPTARGRKRRPRHDKRRSRYARERAP